MVYTMMKNMPDICDEDYWTRLIDELASEGRSCESLNLKPCRYGFDVNTIRKDFPILSQRINGKPLIWLDNAATTQKPASVIERLRFFYERENSNIHRGAHALAARATEAYEEARKKAARFLNASSENDIVFVRGTTEAVNLTATSYGLHHLKRGDEILLTEYEHHANIVPWQMLCRETGAKLTIAPVEEDGRLNLKEYESLLNSRTRIAAFSHVSNVLGSVSPAKEMVSMAKAAGAVTFIDGAQAAAHLKIDVRELGCDFYAFSGHKVFGPTGIGVLYIEPSIAEDMLPYEGGGNMIEDVTFEATQYKKPPHRFEAGTGNIAGAAGLGEALDYLSAIGMKAAFEHEHFLLEYTREILSSIPGVRLLGGGGRQAGLVSFVIDGITTEEANRIFDREGIALRAGHHCAQPILRRFGLESSLRASLAFYNTKEEAERLGEVAERLTDIF